MVKVRLDKFREIKEKYNDFYQTFYSRGKGTVFDTKKGIWGPSGTDDVYDLFVKIKLKDHKSFLDIGSGDGKVVLIASLFCENAVGVEFDKGLNDVGLKIKKQLGLKAKLLCKDFFEHDFSKYDILFINPDKGFKFGLEKKLIEEMKDKAKLFVYNQIFSPRFMKKGKTYWFGQVPVIQYTKG